MNTKTIGIVVLVVIVAVIAAGAFALSNNNDNTHEETEVPDVPEEEPTVEPIDPTLEYKFFKDAGIGTTLTFDVTGNEAHRGSSSYRLAGTNTITVIAADEDSITFTSDFKMDYTGNSPSSYSNTDLERTETFVFNRDGSLQSEDSLFRYENLDSSYTTTTNTDWGQKTVRVISGDIGTIYVPRDTSVEIGQDDGFIYEIHRSTVMSSYWNNILMDVITTTSTSVLSEIDFVPYSA